MILKSSEWLSLSLLYMTVYDSTFRFKLQLLTELCSAAVTKEIQKCCEAQGQSK